MSATKPEVEIAKSYLHFRFSCSSFFISGCRPMLDNVSAGMSESGILENVGVAVEI